MTNSPWKVQNTGVAGGNWDEEWVRMVFTHEVYSWKPLDRICTNKRISAWRMWMPLDNFLNFYEVTQLTFGQHVGLGQPKIKMMSFSCHCKLV